MKSDIAPIRLFVFGLGYSARALARSLRADGATVAGTARDPARLVAEGYDGHRFDATRPMDDAARALQGTTHVLISVPPDADGCPVFRYHAADLRRLPGLAWVGYLSTTGVYGDTGGEWVNEDTPANPGQERGRWRLAAERQWLESGLPAHAFRLAGIYGPGRSALDQIRAGGARRIVKPGHVFSRIHVADIAQVLEASMRRPDRARVYNACDDEPTGSDVVLAEAASLLGVPPPPEIPFAAATLSPMGASFYAELRRVRNDRIKTELGVRLLYPSFREGLRGILSDKRETNSQ